MAGTFGLSDIASLYDPQVAVDQTALQRQMLMAQALRQQSMSPLETQGRQIGGMGYKISPWEAIAKVVQGVQAGRAENQTDQERLAMNQRMMAALTRATGKKDILDDPNGGRPAGVSADALTAGGFPQPAPGQVQSPAQGQAGGDLSMDDLIKMSIYGGIGGPAAAALYAKNRELPDAAKLMTFKGQNPQQIGTLETQELKNKTTQPTTIGRNLGWNPVTQSPFGLPPAPPDGFVSVPDVSSPSGFKLVQQGNGPAAVTTAEGSKARGKLYGDILNGYTATGPAPIQTKADALGLPPLDANVSPTVQDKRDNGPDGRRAILQNELNGETDPKNRAALQKELDSLQGGTATVPKQPVYGTMPPGVENAQNLLDSSWKRVSADNGNAQTSKSYLQGVMKAAEGGAIIGPQYERRELINGLLATAGIDERATTDKATQTAILKKYSANIVATLSQGGMDTDAARAIVANANPGQPMTKDALREVVPVLSAVADMKQAKASFLKDAAIGRDARSYQGREIQFDQLADPRIFQWKAIQDPAQRSAFAKQLMAQDPTMGDRIKKLEGMGAL